MNYNWFSLECYDKKDLSNNVFNSPPVGMDLVIVEHSEVQDGTFYSSMLLNSYDEVGKFDDEYKKPTYGFLSSKASSHLVRKEFDENGECPSELKINLEI